MRARVRTHCRFFGFESLERRSMLAGDITVSLSNGELVIAGDNEANLFAIQGTGAAPGQVTVFALNTDVFFNGQLQGAPLVLSGVTSISIDLNAGDDSVIIENVAVDSLQLETDEGADRVGLGAVVAFANVGGAGIIDPVFGPTTGSVGVNGRVDIDLGTGADVLQMVRVFGGADWNISLGDDDDTTNSLTDDRDGNDLTEVALDDQAYIFVASADSVHVRGGSGDDLINVAYLTAFDPVHLDGGLGNDVTSVMGSVFHDNVHLFSGSGIDTIAVDFSRFEQDNALLEIDSGADDDFVLVARSLLPDGVVIIRTGQGNDRAVLGRFFCGPEGGLLTGGNIADIVRLDMGSDNDVADIRGNVVEQFYGILGGGDDEMTVAFNVVNDSALLDGGASADDLFAAGNLFNRATTVGFEGQFAFTGPAEDTCTEIDPGDGDGEGNGDGEA